MQPLRAAYNICKASSTVVEERGVSTSNGKGMPDATGQESSSISAAYESMVEWYSGGWRLGQE
jgi:hypothetical protein